MAKMNVNSLITKDYRKNDALASKKTNPNKPNLRKAKMNVNLYYIEDYRKKDDFFVRINKPNLQNAKNERKLICYKGL